MYFCGGFHLPNPCAQMRKAEDIHQANQNSFAKIFLLTSLIIIRAKEMYDSVYIALRGTGDKCCTSKAQNPTSRISVKMSSDIGQNERKGKKGKNIYI